MCNGKYEYWTGGPGLPMTISFKNGARILMWENLTVKVHDLLFVLYGSNLLSAVIMAVFSNLVLILREGKI